MAAKSYHIDLVQQPETDSAPSCSHGPALLFERYDKTVGASRQFYACSAFRDRKICSFFKWADEKQTKPMSSRPDQNDSYSSHRDQRKRYQQFKKIARKDRHVCCTCGLLLLKDDEVEDHQNQGHTLRHKVGLKQLRTPSYLFSSLDDNKTFAQYLFSQKTVDFLIKTIENLGCSHVLCVGAPRIHEAIQIKFKAQERTLQSMLLDLDDRYAALYPPAKYAKYNMFNHHFFESKGQKHLNQFLVSGGSRTLLFTDPPFGGMVEALAASFKKINQAWRRVYLEDESSAFCDKTTSFIPTIWIFPYFMEARIVSEMPSGFQMLDYKVDYDNHNLFQNQKKVKGSPVRIFTNLPALSIPLPAEDGYRFCEACQRYSSQENKHCKECKSCPSKDGTTYVHCDMCMRCVKATYVHCFKCEMCKLKEHACGMPRSKGCHMCGDLSHKKRECPQRINLSGRSSENLQKRMIKRKRKSSIETCDIMKVPRK